MREITSKVENWFIERNLRPLDCRGQLEKLNEGSGRMKMDIKIDPTEIKSIESSTPVTITFDNGNTLTAYSFIFEDLTHYATRENESWGINIKADLQEVVE